MPPIKCSYIKCNNTSKDYSMFRFPTGHAKRAVWLSNCGNMTITNLKNEELRNRYLCITHFDDKFIQNKTGKRIRISKLAVPQNHNDEQISHRDDKFIQIKTGKRRLSNMAVPQNHDEQISVMTPHSPRPSTSQAGDCKKRWQCLRDAYRRALNKKKRKSEHEAKNMKPWRYESEMAFVAPFLIERKTKDAVGVTSGDELSDNGEENCATEFNASEKPYNDFEVDETPAECSDANSTKSDEVPQNESQQICTKKPKAVKRKIDQSEPDQTRDLSSDRSVRAVLMAKLLDEQNKLEPPRGHDELDRFFLSISDTVKKFPPYVQALTKNKIFTLVSEMELQQLAPSNSTTFNFNPSPQTSTSAIPTLPTCPDNDNRSEQIQHFFQKFNTSKQNKS